MKLTVEHRYPLYGALLAWALWLYFRPSFPASEKEFLGAAISVSAILTGFIATAKAILAALPPDSVMGRIRAAGYGKDLVAYLRAALYTCLGFSIYGLFGFFVQSDGHHYLNSWYAGIWIFLGVWALLAFHRVAHLLLRIIGHEEAPTPPQRPVEPPIDRLP